MRKRIWLIVAIMLCVVGLTITTASAASGTYDGLSWNLDSNGTLTLSGTLANTEVRSDTVWPWRSSTNRSSVKHIVFSSGTTLQGSLAYMFQDCTNLIDVDFSGVDTSNVWTFRDMFRGCSHLTTIDGLSGLGTNTLRQTANMFYGCSALESVTLFNWDTTFLTESDTPDDEEVLTPTARHATAENMFRDCSSLTSITFGTFKTNRVVSFSSMFRGCSSLTSLTLPREMNTELAFGFAQMFYGCSSLESLTLPEKFNTNNGMAMNDMFRNCDSLKSVVINSDISPFKGRANGFYSDSWTPESDAYSSLPTPPTNDDYTGKWILSDGGVAYTPYELTVQYDETKAGTYVWQETAYSGTVIYDANEGILIGDQTITVDEEHRNITLPDATKISRLHHIFKGWQVNGIGDLLNGSYSVPKGSTTLVASWEYTTIRKYTVKHYQLLPDMSGYRCVATEEFTGNAGDWVTPEVHEYDNFASPDPQRVQIADDDSTLVEYYYDRPGYSIVFDGNGSTMGSMPRQPMTVGIQAQLLANQYIRKGWLFLGWNTEADGSGNSYSDQQAVLDLSTTNKDVVTLYAQWLDNTGNTLVPTDGVVEVTLKAGQTLTIPDLPAGVTYEIEEIGMGQGWSFVEDENTSGTIQAGQTSEATVKNEYNAEGDITLEIYKSEVNGLTGLQQMFEENKYEFEVVDGSGKVVSTGKSGSVSEDLTAYDTEGHEIDNPLFGKAVVSFEPIHYETEDLGQTYTYTIREANTPDHYTNDGPITVTVQVRDHMDGTIDGIVSYNHNQTIVNTDHSGGRLIVKKAGYTEDCPKDELFNFTITFKTADGQTYADDVHCVITGIDQDTGDVVEHSTVIKSGDTFGLSIGEYASFVLPVGTKYTVTEAESESWTLVGVSNASGTIVADTTVEAEFTNAYQLDGALVLTAKKVLEGGDFTYDVYGRDGSVVGTEVRKFLFQVLGEDGNTVATGENDEEGNVTFTAIPFVNDDIGKTFHYTVKEYIPADQSGYVYDTTIYTVDVTVGSDNNEMTFDKIINDGNAEEIVFTNEIVTDVDLPIEGIKELTGRPFREGDKWTFTLNSDDGPVPAEFEVEVDAFRDPTFLFTLHFTTEDLGTNASKTFTYTITESGNVVGVRNDDAPHTIKVTVSRSGSALTAVIDEDASDSLTWTNELMEGIKLPGTGSMTAVYLALIGLVIMVGAFVIFRKKSQKEEE